ncbi:cobalamin biosynthesis protein [Methylobacterium sp. Leaf117]|uniref:cobalamin biosynthesis protein n=1 Tax=Methylobacterium sp. Leaf117 TaxID=1736260 RepID=UPI0009E94EE4
MPGDSGPPHPNAPHPAPPHAGPPLAGPLHADPPHARAPDLIAGIGFRRATPADEILALVARACDAAGVPLARVARLATAADRAGEPPIRSVADALGRPLDAIPSEAMIAVDAQVSTRSPRIEASRRVGSVAEAAALAGAGAGATLVVRRIASAGATCALALRAQSVTQGS